jgi:hypothetical protein
MDVAPAFVAVDGVKFPLVVDGGQLRLADDPRFPGLAALSYVAGHLIARPAAARLAELTERRGLLHQVLSASFIEPRDRDDLGDGVANWTRLAGAPPDLDDAYLIGTTWIAQALVVPRRTLIRLIEQVGALHDAVATQQLEPRIAGVPEAGPVNPPPAADAPDDDGDGGAVDHHDEASERAARGSVGDDLLRDLETMAVQVDELDAAARQGDVPYASVARNAAAAAKRQLLHLELAAAGLVTPEPPAPARAALTRLGLTRLLGYVDAAQALARYLASAERAARFPDQPPPAALAAQVSLDWFRVPSGYRPDGVTEHEWLALCEKAFASPLPSSSAGSRSVRLCGAMHQLHYRAEVGAGPCLWRAQR